MGKLSLQHGTTMDWVNNTGADISANEFFALGDLVVMAMVNINNGEAGTVAIEEVYREAPKVLASEFQQGQLLAWDSAANAFKSVDDGLNAGDVNGGAIAWYPAAGGQASCVVKLVPGTGSVVPAAP
jgi:predicted RecA/RadA family phage recombinase